MGKFNKTGKREMPALNTSSLPDLIDVYKRQVLLAGSLKIGAILAGATAEDAENLYNFGMQIGVAFQLQDDLLDVYGDPEVFGKKIGGDILCNKKTYMLIKALNLSLIHIFRNRCHWGSG